VKHANPTIFKGDSMDAAAVEKASEGHEAVISIGINSSAYSAYDYSCNHTATREEAMENVNA
jgi:hypothetical protein